MIWLVGYLLVGLGTYIRGEHHQFVCRLRGSFPEASIKDSLCGFALCILLGPYAAWRVHTMIQRDLKEMEEGYERNKK